MLPPLLKPLHGFATLLGDTFDNFQIDDCDRATAEGRDWHVRAHGYCFPFDERREFVWHVTGAEVDELIKSGPSGTIKALQHQPQERSFNQVIAETPELLWNAMGIPGLPVLNR